MKYIVIILTALLSLTAYSQVDIECGTWTQQQRTDAQNTNFDSVYQKTNSYTTPEIFGALGDGITDDATAINNAIDYLDQQGGGVLLFSNKNYLVGSFINVSDKSNIRLLGVGNSSIITRGFIGGIVTIAFGNTNLCSIENIYIDQNLQESGAAISISNSSNFALKTTTVNDSYGSPIILYSSNNIILDGAIILNSQFSSTGNHGIDIDVAGFGEEYEITRDVKIINSYIQNEGHQAIKLENCQNFVIQNNTFYGNIFASDDDKRVSNVRNIIVQNNTFYPNKDIINGNSGMSFGSNVRDGSFKIINNTMDSCGIYGIGESSDSLFTVDVTHNTTNNNITISDIEIGLNQNEKVPHEQLKISDIINLGDQFTLNNATGFTQNYMIDSILNDSSFVALIVNESPSQITALTDVNIVLNRTNKYNITVSGNSISNEYTGVNALIGGVYLRGASPLISNNTISNTKLVAGFSSSGVVLYDCDNGFVSNNLIFNNPFAGVYLNFCNKITVSNNKDIRSSNYGIFSESSNTIKSLYNNISDIDLYAFYSYPADGLIVDGVEFSNNKISNSGDSITTSTDGLIYIRRFDNNAYHSNLKIINNIIDASVQNTGYVVSVDNSNVFNISNNNIQNGGNGGVYLRRLCNNGIISDNFIDSCNYGIFISADAQGGCSYNQISGNYLNNNNNDGIRMQPLSTTTCKNNQIRDNYINSNGVTTTGYGIRILSAYSDNNIIESNIFLNTGSTQDFGIQIYGNNNVVRFNDLTDAGTTKLDNQGTGTTISDNIGYP